MSALISHRDRKAPYFDGKSRHLLDFLAEYDLITATANVSGKDKIVSVVNYVNRQDAELWRTFASFKQADWDDFRKDIMKGYPGLKESRSYTLNDLSHITTHWKRKRIYDLHDLGKYHREFTRISSYLKEKGLAESIINRYYLSGFHSRLRDQIEDRLEQLDPTRDLDKVEAVTTVYEAASRILSKRTDYLLDSFTSRQRSPSLERRRRSPHRSRSRAHRRSRSRSKSASSHRSSKDRRSHSSDSEDDHHRGRHRSRSRSRERRGERKTPETTIKQESSDTTTNFIKEIIAQQAQQSQEQVKLLAAAINSLSHTQLSTTTQNASVARPSPRNYGCNFCGQPEHMMRDCKTLMRYLLDDKAIRDSTGKLTTPSGVPIPPGEKGQPLQVRLDSWLAANSTLRTKSASKPTTTATTAFIEPIEDSFGSIHFFEVETYPDHAAEALQLDIGNETEDEFVTLVESWANEAKKTLRGRKNAKVDEGTKAKGPSTSHTDSNTQPHQPLTSTASSKASTTTSNTNLAAPAPPPNPTGPNGTYRPPPRAKFVSQADDPALQEEIVKLVLNNKIDGGNITLKHILAVSPPIRAKLAEFLRTHRVDSTSSIPTTQTTLHITGSNQGRPKLVVGEDSVPLREVTCSVGCVENELAVLDEGSTVVVVREDLWNDTGLPLQREKAMPMQGANGDVTSTLGAIVDLPVQIGEITFYVQAQVVQNAPFRLLFGRPFFTLAQSSIENREGGQTWLTIRNPNPPFQVITVPTSVRRPRCRHHHDEVASNHYFHAG
jgi:hypothetical protein